MTTFSVPQSVVSAFNSASALVTSGAIASIERHGGYNSLAELHGILAKQFRRFETEVCGVSGTPIDKDAIAHGLADIAGAAVKGIVFLSGTPIPSASAQFTPPPDNSGTAAADPNDATRKRLAEVNQLIEGYSFGDRPSSPPAHLLAERRDLELQIAHAHNTGTPAVDAVRAATVSAVANWAGTTTPAGMQLNGVATLPAGPMLPGPDSPAYRVVKAVERYGRAHLANKQRVGIDPEPPDLKEASAALIVVAEELAMKGTGHVLTSA